MMKLMTRSLLTASVMFAAVCTPLSAGHTADYPTTRYDRHYYGGVVKAPQAPYEGMVGATGAYFAAPQGYPGSRPDESVYWGYNWSPANPAVVDAVHVGFPQNGNGN